MKYFKILGRFILSYVICSFGIAWGSTIEAALRVYFFDTGQGNCIAVRMDDFHSNDSKLIQNSFSLTVAARKHHYLKKI